MVYKFMCWFFGHQVGDFPMVGVVRGKTVWYRRADPEEAGFLAFLTCSRCEAVIKTRLVETEGGSDHERP